MPLTLGGARRRDAPVSLIWPGRSHPGPSILRLSPAFHEQLTARGISLVDTPDEEFDSMGTNVLALAPRRCVMLSGTRAPAPPRNAGATVVEYAVPRSAVKGAAATCLTRPLVRPLVPLLRSRRLVRRGDRLGGPMAPASCARRAWSGPSDRQLAITVGVVAGLFAMAAAACLASSRRGAQVGGFTCSRSGTRRRLRLCARIGRLARQLRRGRLRVGGGSRVSASCCGGTASAAGGLHLKSS